LNVNMQLATTVRHHRFQHDSYAEKNHKRQGASGGDRIQMDMAAAHYQDFSRSTHFGFRTRSASRAMDTTLPSCCVRSILPFLDASQFWALANQVFNYFPRAREYCNVHCILTRARKIGSASPGGTFSRELIPPAAPGARLVKQVACPHTDYAPSRRLVKNPWSISATLARLTMPSKALGEFVGLGRAECSGADLTVPGRRPLSSAGPLASIPNFPLATHASRIFDLRGSNRLRCGKSPRARYAGITLYIDGGKIRSRAILGLRTAYFSLAS
jgi:hypothetical protein